METGIVSNHLDYLRRLNRRPRTIEARFDVLRRFTNWTGLPLASTEREHVEGYIDGKTAPATRRVYLCHLAGFFAWAVDEDIYPADPTRRVARAKIPTRLPRPIDEADLLTAYAAAVASGNDMMRAWLTLGGWAGLRACEIGPVSGEHRIVGDSPTLVIPVSKGGGMSAVPLSPFVNAEFDRWPARGPLWKPDGGYHHVVVTRLITNHFRALGMGWTCHNLRHRYGTMLYRASGHDLRVTQSGMRHLSISSTVLYTKIEDETVAAAVANVPTPEVVGAIT